MKKTIALLLTLVMVFATCGTAFASTDESADTSSAVAVGSAEVALAEGEESTTYEIPVSISNNEGIAAVKFTISGVDFTGATVEANFGTLEYNNTGADLLVLWWNEAAPKTDDVMFTITNTYEVGELVSGEYPISAVAEDVVNDLENATTMITTAGTLTVIDGAVVAVPGDINGDGKISNVDVVMMSRYLVNMYEAGSEEALAVEANGDISGDGKISNADLVRLARIIVEG